ncbi:hypothetical protein Hanom_Chr02g00114981 [Helianthus anomalus]
MQQKGVQTTRKCSRTSQVVSWVGGVEAGQLTGEERAGWVLFRVGCYAFQLEFHHKREYSSVVTHLVCISEGAGFESCPIHFFLFHLMSFRTCQNRP